MSHEKYVFVSHHIGVMTCFGFAAYLQDILHIGEYYHYLVLYFVWLWKTVLICYYLLLGPLSSIPVSTILAHSSQLSTRSLLHQVLRA